MTTAVTGSVSVSSRAGWTGFPRSHRTARSPRIPRTRRPHRAQRREGGFGGATEPTKLWIVVGRYRKDGVWSKPIIVLDELIHRLVFEMTGKKKKIHPSQQVNKIKSLRNIFGKLSWLHRFLTLTLPTQFGERCFSLSSWYCPSVFVLLSLSG